MAEAAARLRRLLAGSPDLTERRMFGGVCFMRRDHMLCGTHKTGVLLRVGAAAEPALLQVPGTRPMQQNGRTMRGFVWADPAQLDDAALTRWIAVADAYVASLPPKTAKPAGRSRTS